MNLWHDYIIQFGISNIKDIYFVSLWERHEVFLKLILFVNYLIVFIFNAQSKNKQWVWHEPNTILRSHALLFHISSQISLFAFSIEDNLMKFYMLVLIKIKKHFLRCSHVNWKIDFYLNKSLSATMQTSCVPYWAKYFFSVMFFFCCVVQRVINIYFHMWSIERP